MSHVHSKVRAGHAHLAELQRAPPTHGACAPHRRAPPTALGQGHPRTRATGPWPRARARRTRVYASRPRPLERRRPRPGASWDVHGCGSRPAGHPRVCRGGGGCPRLRAAHVPVWREPTREVCPMRQCGGTSPGGPPRRRGEPMPAWRCLRQERHKSSIRRLPQSWVLPLRASSLGLCQQSTRGPSTGGAARPGRVTPRAWSWSLRPAPVQSWPAGGAGRRPGTPQTAERQPLGA